MKQIYVIKTGDTFPSIAKQYGDFEDWIITRLGIDNDKVKVINAEKGAPLPRINHCKGVVIAGSHAMVTQNLDWSLKVESWISGVVKANVPLLGICYGHQLIAKAMGGQVDYHPGGIEIGSVKINQVSSNEDDPLFKGLPPDFYVHASHSQTITRLPEEAVLLAENRFEPHQAFRLGPCTWGVQFHPEYDENIMKAYIEDMASEIVKTGNNERRLLSQVVETPQALQIIQRFGRVAARRSGVGPQ